MLVIDVFVVFVLCFGLVLWCCVFVLCCGGCVFFCVALWCCGFVLCVRVVFFVLRVSVV